MEGFLFCFLLLLTFGGVQSLEVIEEDDVEFVVREKDLKILSSVLPDAQAKYKEKTGKNVTVKESTKYLDASRYLDFSFLSLFLFSFFFLPFPLLVFFLSLPSLIPHPFPLALVVLWLSPTTVPSSSLTPWSNVFNCPSKPFFPKFVRNSLSKLLPLPPFL